MDNILINPQSQYLSLHLKAGVKGLKESALIGSGRAVAPSSPAAGGSTLSLQGTHGTLLQARGLGGQVMGLNRLHPMNI